MSKDEVITKLKEAKPQLPQRYGLTMLALLGSYSRNEQKTESDIDLLVDFSAVTVNYFFTCSLELQDLFKDTKVEIVTRGGIKPKYFEAIKSDLLYV